MANKRGTPKNLRPPWRPGESGNRSGKPKGVLTGDQVRVVIAKYAQMTKAQLAQAVTSSEIPMLELTVASIFAQAAKTGDYGRLASLLDRAIGRPNPEPLRLEDGDEMAHLSTTELIQIVKRKHPQLLRED